MSNEFFAEFFTVIFGTFGWLLEIWGILKDAFLPSKYEKDVKGKKVLLVGSGDLGLELAKGLHTRGAHIAFWDWDQKTLDEIQKSFPRSSSSNGQKDKLITQQVDIRNFDQIQKAAKKLQDDGFEVDILLNAAGVLHQKDCFDESIDQVDKIIDVNLKGVIHVIRTFIPKFYERKHGHFVTIASLAGVAGCPHVCEYSASKFGVIGYMESIEVDALARGLNELEFTTLCPGFIKTKMVKDVSFTGQPKWTFSSIEEAVPALLTAILQTRHSIVWPWQARLVVSFKHVLSERQMNKLLARQWPY